MTTNLSSESPSEAPKPAKGTFGYDCTFIKAHDPEAIVLGQGAARILVSPKYQARIFTSTTDGDTGMGFGWINYDAFEGALVPQINAYGGENRLSLGPQGGPYGLLFQKGASMTLEHLQSPLERTSEPWTVNGTGLDSVTFFKEMELQNRKGTQLSLKVDRVIRLLPPQAMDNITGPDTHSGLLRVGYTTFQTLTNTGKEPWNEETGMPCLRVLDRFPASDKAVVMLPYTGFRKPQNTGRPGEIEEDRLRMYGETLFYKADGKSRGKVGIKPARARNTAGSYDPLRRVLTIIQFSIDPAGRYLSQDFRPDKSPFNGEVVYAHNDGAIDVGNKYEPFYELESVSPAAALKSMGCIHHRHTVIHCIGAEADLDLICQIIFGVSCKDIKHILA